MIQWGVLYPSLLAIALLPASIALVVQLRGWLKPRDARIRTAIGAALLIATALVALALSQTSLILIWGLLAGCFALWRLVAAWPAATRRSRIAMLVTAAVCLALLVIAWWVLGRIVTGGVWPQSRGRWQAVLDIVVNGHVGFPPAWGISILMALGLFVAVRRPSLRWLATSWFAFAVLYFVAVAVGNPTVAQHLGSLLQRPIPYRGDPAGRDHPARRNRLCLGGALDRSCRAIPKLRQGSGTAGSGRSGDPGCLDL